MKVQCEPDLTARQTSAMGHAAGSNKTLTLDLQVIATARETTLVDVSSESASYVAASWNLDDVTLPGLDASYDDLVTKAQRSYSADELVVVCKEQIIRETGQHANNHICVAELLQTNEKLEALSDDTKASTVNGRKFINGVCC